MGKKINVVVAGHSSFAWGLVEQLRTEVMGRLYFVLPERDQAMEASLLDDVIAIHGEITDTAVLDQLNLETCHTFIAGSRGQEANVLSALYARNSGAQAAYARVFDTKFMPLLDAVGVIPIQTSHMAAARMKVRALKPAVAELVQPTHGPFVLDEIRVSQYPELVGCQLGQLHSKELHVVAVAHGDDVQINYETVIEADAVLVVIYNRQVTRNLAQALRRVTRDCPPE